MTKWWVEALRGNVRGTGGIIYVGGFSRDTGCGEHLAMCRGGTWQEKDHYLHPTPGLAERLRCNADRS